MLSNLQGNDFFSGHEIEGLIFRNVIILLQDWLALDNVSNSLNVSLEILWLEACG